MKVVLGKLGQTLTAFCGSLWGKKPKAQMKGKKNGNHYQQNPTTC